MIVTAVDLHQADTFSLCSLGSPVIEYDDALKKPQTLKRDNTLILMVNIFGHPVPNVSWFYNDKELTVETGINIEGDGTFSRLTVKKVSSANAGTYRVQAENEVGTATAEFSVVVKGKCWEDYTYEN